MAHIRGLSLALYLAAMRSIPLDARQQSVSTPPGGSLAAQAFAPQEVVDAALTLVGLRSNDVVVDLGSGDGRVVLSAARRGAKGVGIDIDGELIAASRREANALGLDTRARFEVQDFLKTDVGHATIVFVYLSREGMDRIRQQVIPNLKKGSRLISVSFDLPGWEPERVQFVKDARGVQYILYMWTIS